MQPASGAAPVPAEDEEADGLRPGGRYQGWVSHPDFGERVPANLHLTLERGRLHGKWQVMKNSGFKRNQWDLVFKQDMEAGGSSHGHETYDVSRWVWTCTPSDHMTAKIHVELKKDRLLYGELLRLPSGRVTERPTPVARWNFRKGKRDPLKDDIWGLQAHASGPDWRIEEDGLILFGHTCVYSDPLGFSLRCKTLEVWVELFNLEQREVGVMGVGEMSAADAKFDAIVFNQRHHAEWISCSDFFNRSQGIAGGAEKRAGILHHLVITYSEDNTITLYRDGLPYGNSYQVEDQLLCPTSSKVVFGARHFWPDDKEGVKFVGGLTGRIKCAALYDRALTREEVALNAGAGTLKMWPIDRPGVCEKPDDEANVKAIRKEFPQRTADIQDTAERAITLPQLQRVLRFASQRCHIWGRGKASSMMTLDLYDLCKWLIMPATLVYRCALVELLAGREQEPEWFVSHWWGECIVDFVRCLSRHALLRRLPYDAGFWVCAYANRQHSIASEVSEEKLQNTSFYRAMNLAVGVLLVLDACATALTRIWCAFEEFEAVEFSGAYTEVGTDHVEPPRLLDIVVCHEGEAVVLSEGPVDQDNIDYKVTLAKASREEHFPMDIVEQGLNLCLAKAEATQAEDKRRILDWMELKGGSDEANRRLRAVFAIASWRQCVLKGKVSQMQLPKVLSNDCSRRSLKFDFSYLWKFNNEDAYNFAEGIPSSLQDLELHLEWCINLGDDGLRRIAEALEKTEIRVLYLNVRDCNQLSGDAIAYLVNKLPECVRNIRIALHQEVDDDCVKKLAEQLGGKSGLEKVKLSFVCCSKISSSVIPGLVSSLPSSMKALSLNLMNCSKTNDDALSEIAEKLPSKLADLSLICEECPLVTEQGVLAFARELDKRGGSQLRSLELRAAPHLTVNALEHLRQWKRKKSHRGLARMATQRWAQDVVPGSPRRRTPRIGLPTIAAGSAAEESEFRPHAVSDASLSSTVGFRTPHSEPTPAALAAAGGVPQRFQEALGRFPGGHMNAAGFRKLLATLKEDVPEDQIEVLVSTFAASRRGAAAGAGGGGGGGGSGEEEEGVDLGAFVAWLFEENGPDVNAHRHIGWGIIGCADIARKTCRGVAEADNASVVSVASRSLSKAEAFAEANASGATPYDTYDAILDDDRVDVVYIPLPTAMKKEWVIKAARKGKHVLCEKPLAETAEDAEAMIRACAEARVQFMDNTLMMHHSRLEEIKTVVADRETFGAIQHVASCFTIPFGNSDEWAQSNIRMNASLEPLGALGDLGWYNIRISQWAFDYEDPQTVSCHYIEETAEGVPVVAHAILRYSGGRTATFDCSFRCCLRQWAEVVGEKRTLSWDDLCVTQLKEEAPFTVATADIGDNAITFPKEVIETRNVTGCVQHTALIEKMSDLVQGGKPDDHWPRISLQTQKIMMALHRSAKQRGSWVSCSEASAG